MNAMAAEYEDHGRGRCKHVLSTYWAIAIGNPLDAFMGMFHGHGHAGAASLGSS